MLPPGIVRWGVVGTRLAILGSVAASLGVADALTALASQRRAPAAASARRGPCAGWRVHTLLRGQGWLENLAFDGRGSITLSALDQGRILRLSRKRRLSTLVRVSGPGGQARRGHILYFTTGVLPAPTLRGTIDRLDLRTGRRSTWARGLNIPNGLAILRNGDAVVSRDLGLNTGLTRVRARDPRHPQFGWARLDDTNGLAVDPRGRWLYVARIFSAMGEVDRVSIAHPRRVKAVGYLGAGAMPDDMTVDQRGILYIAGFGNGKVYRLDPRTHASCAIARGLARPTSARFGGPGWRTRSLYVTDVDGHLYELSPPRRR
jgi:hypothetical protein